MAPVVRLGFRSAPLLDLAAGKAGVGFARRMSCRVQGLLGPAFSHAGGGFAGRSGLQVGGGQGGT